MPPMTIGIIGLGYVGLPLASAFADAGHDVVGVDSDSRAVEAIAAGRSLVADVADDELAALRDRLRATTDPASLADCDAIVICVPTPLANQREPDLSYVVDAARTLSPLLRAGQLVVLESTTYPGTTRERLRSILEEAGLSAGPDFHLAYSPERIDPGRTDHTIRTTPKVVGGVTAACRERAVALYGAICDEVSAVSSPEAAELSKLLENIFRSVNIALVNELAILCDRMKIDIWEVIDAAATKPFGFMRFEPGPGMSGHCLPIDPFHLAFKAREDDLATEFIELACHDPHVAEVAELGLRSADLDEGLGSCDVAGVVTAHPEVDYERVVAEAPLVLDFRGITQDISASNLVRL
jgi:UDP-N-acetyl-D-glucosamine dehydrogenase